MADKVRVLIFLGNPGAKYQENRHNLGFWVAEALAESLEASFVENKTCQFLKVADVYLLKPKEYVNQSGKSVSQFLRERMLLPSQLVVVYDDIDLEVGTVRIRQDGASGGHRGIISLIEYLGEKIIRVKIGIGRDQNLPAAKYVLLPPTISQKKILKKAVEEARKILSDYIFQKIELANKTYHINEESD